VADVSGRRTGVRLPNDRRARSRGHADVRRADMFPPGGRLVARRRRWRAPRAAG